MNKIAIKKPTLKGIKDWWSCKVKEFKSWNAERKDRCTLDRIYEDQEKGGIVRYRDKHFKKSELPSTAIPVTGMRNTWAIVSLDPPEPAPYGQTAVVLFAWSRDYSFKKSFEHLSNSDNPPLDWKKILIVGGIAIAGVYLMFVTGVIG